MTAPPIPPVAADRGAIIRAPLIRAHAIDMSDKLVSLAISMREAFYLESDDLASMHADQIRLVFREVALCHNELQAIKKAQR